jgi:hypothetical protein
MIQTNDYTIGIYYFSATDTVFSSKSKDGLAKNPDNLSKWSDMSTCKQLFQRACTITHDLQHSRTAR